MNQPWHVGVVADWQRKALAELNVTFAAPEPDQRIVAPADVWQQPRLYWTGGSRPATTTAGGTSGSAERRRAIGPAEPPAYEAVRVGDVVAARPDLAQLLSLPAGTTADPGRRRPDGRSCDDARARRLGHRPDPGRRRPPPTTRPTATDGAAAAVTPTEAEAATTA